MQIDKNGIVEVNKQAAVDILNKLRIGVRTFGVPATGLRRTLAKLGDDAPEKDSFDSVKYNLNDREYEQNIRKLKAGIKGEEELGEYFEKVIRLDDELSDMVVFASLGDVDTDKDYIPDTDFVCMYGDNMLMVDAKNIKTKPEVPIFVKGDGIYSVAKQNEPLLEVRSARGVWEDILARDGAKIDSITGCVCIVNKSGAEVFRNEAWWDSDIKPVHISGFLDYVKEWIVDKEPVYSLNTLATISRMQIQQDEDDDLDLTAAKRLFSV